VGLVAVCVAATVGGKIAAWIEQGDDIVWDGRNGRRFMTRWCVLLTRELPGTAKGAVLADAPWERGGEISISFLDGDPELQSKIRGVAEQWLTRTSANLFFQWRNDTTKTDIRISFRFAGSWSLLGKQALLETDCTKPTMNFGWLNPQATDDDIQEVVLHEFGHALGLIHEHQNPEAQIPWNRDAVIEELSNPPNSWSVEQIERNVLSGFDRSQLYTTPYDEKSIMLYPVNPAWTVGGYQTTANKDLSEHDIELIREIYGRS
jgi:serralysin